MPACTVNQKIIKYHQIKTNPPPKCGSLDKIMETRGIHINGHLNAKTLFDLNLDDLSSRSCSCTPLYPFSALKMCTEYKHRLHTVAVLSCPVVAMLLRCALDLLQCVKTAILQLDFHCLQVDEDRARQIW